MDIIVTLITMKSKPQGSWKHILGSRRVGRSSLVVFLIYSSKYCKQEGSYSFTIAKLAFDEIVLPTKLA
jgi:hypothetical protein